MRLLALEVHLLLQLSVTAALADELLELLKREKELNVPSKDCDPYVDAYLKANAASTPDHIATEAGQYTESTTAFADLCVMNQSTAYSGLCSLMQPVVAHLSVVSCEVLLLHMMHAKFVHCRAIKYRYTFYTCCHICDASANCRHQADCQLRTQQNIGLPASIALVLDVCRLP